MRGPNMSFQEMTNGQKRQIIQSAGYTICNHGVGTLAEGWYALLPGETEFFDNIDEAEANPEVAHIQNYLGFFSSEQDLLDDIAEDLFESGPLIGISPFAEA